jgi:hypothetical protein
MDGLILDLDETDLDSQDDQPVEEPLAAGQSTPTEPTARRV